MRGYKSFKKPHPGMLKHRIEIGTDAYTLNDNGFPEPREKVICRVWAQVDNAGNQAYRSADAYDVEYGNNFAIRYRDDIEAGMWIKWDGVKWMINALEHFGYDKTYLGLKATITEGVGR